MTFQEFANAWAKQGLQGVLAIAPVPVLIPLEPWARSPGPRRTQFNTLGPPPDPQTPAGAETTDDGLSPLLRPVHTALGDRFPAPRIHLQLVRKTDRNVYAHVAIGRSNNNDIPLDQPSVSRFHADLRRSESGWQVRDAKSRNGTRLNGEPVVATHGQPIAGGDVITFGEASCVFCPIAEEDLRRVLGARDSW